MGVITDLHRAEIALPTFEEPSLLALGEPRPAASLAEHRATLAGVVQAKLGELGLTDEPVYEGDLDTAVLHNFGEDCLGRQADYVRREAVKFQRAITAGRRAVSGRPILVIAPNERDAWGKVLGYDSFLAALEPGQPQFVSTLGAYKITQKHTFNSQTAQVTDRLIALKARTARAEGNILADDEVRLDDQVHEELPIYRSGKVENGASYRSPDAAFHDYRLNCLDGARLFVGWTGLARALAAADGRNLQSAVAKARTLLQRAGLEAELAPRLAGVL